MKIKRIAALAAAALLTVSCVSCSVNKAGTPADESKVEESVPEGVTGSAGNEEINQIPNPMTDVSSVEDINSAVGCSMKNIESASDESYTVFTEGTKLANMNFSLTMQNTPCAPQKLRKTFREYIPPRAFSANLLKQTP